MKHVYVVVLVMACLVLGISYAIAGGPGELFDGFENGKPKVFKNAEVIYKANKDKPTDQFKKLEMIKGYVKEKDLPEGAQRLKEELMTLGDFEAKKGNKSHLEYVDNDRMLWVVETKYPSYETKNGTLLNVNVTSVWDAETGEIFGAEYEGKPGNDFMTPFKRHDQGEKSQ